MLSPRVRFPTEVNLVYTAWPFPRAAFSSFFLPCFEPSLFWEKTTMLGVDLCFQEPSWVCPPSSFLSQRL